MKKQLLLLVAILSPLMASAHDIEAANADGITIYYEWINDSTELAVSYRTVSAGGGGYYVYHEYAGDIVIPESVIYNDKTYIVTSIGTSAFESCNNLVSVTIPKSVKDINRYAFRYSGNLSSIIVSPENPKYDSRENCNAVIETATDLLIVGCKNTTIPSNVIGIGDYAFAGCSGLTSLTIPSNVTSIGECAFEECSDLTSLTIPASVTSIGKRVFSNCGNLSSIVVDPENAKYDSRDNCNAIIETEKNMVIAACKYTTISSSVTSIDEYAFYQCPGLTSIEIPDNITTIGKGAFHSCKDLLSVKIGTGVSVIEDNTFRSCISLKTISFGINVQEIKSGVLSNCNYLENIISLNTVPPTLAQNIFSSREWRSKTNVIIQVPLGCLEAYKNADVWNRFTYIIESDLSNPSACYIIDALNFPDEKFRDYLLNEPFGNDRVLTEEEIANITTLNVSNLGISDLKGIEFFTALKKLLCYKNNLTELNLSANKQLKEVDCYNNKIIGIKMDSLLASLPTLNEGEGSLYLLDATDEGNICFTSQVSYAKSKGWVVYHYTGSEWQEYEGREPGILITEEYFPDENFREYLMKQDYGQDMIISDDEIKNITTISLPFYSPWVSHEYDFRVSTLKGIEYFTSLKSLDCSYNKLTSLDVSINTELTEISCGHNALTEINVSNNTKLSKLYSESNPLQELDVSNNTVLTELYCGGNQLTNLDISKNLALTKLSFHHNNITTIDLSKNKALTWVACPDNQLTDIDVSKNTALTYLYCPYNQLTSLDVSKNSELIEIACMGNQLTSLDVSKNLKLKTLKCQTNRINGERMLNMIVGLPTQESATLCIVNERADENVCTKALVKKAKEKGWKVMCGYEYWGSGPDAYYPNYSEYEGSESGDIYIDEETFPDPYFCEYLKKQPYGEDCIITEKEIGTITSIYVGGGGGLSSLEGIEHFTALETLDCYARGMKSLDVSKNIALKNLYCYWNSLTSLDISNNTALQHLDCRGNKLNSLDISNNTALQYLDCDANQLTSLDVSRNIALQYLDCCWNQLTRLDISNNSNLNELYLCGNMIKEESMDVLVKDLPQRTQSSYARLGVVDLINESEGNVCTTAQVAIAKEKGWRVQACTGNYSWSDYEGSNPSGVQSVVLNKNANSSVYNLNGRRLKGAGKGINIIGGKKVIIK